MTFLSFSLASGLLAVFHGLLDSNFKPCAFVVNVLINEEIEKSSGHYLGLICDESLTCRDLNSNPGYFGSFTFIFVLFTESHLLVSWCAGGRCSMVCSDEDHGKNRRPGVEDQRWSHRLGSR
jgi:hypothetical protein